MLLAEVQAAFDELEGSRVLVACSGGVDSVALADACVEVLGCQRVALGHVDHRVRVGSHEEVEQVRALAEALMVPFFTRALAPGSAAEARLRTERYAALESMRVDSGADLIATAHHRGDQAETVLLNLIRGTRLAGLRGIPARRDRIIRPMLRVPREDVVRHVRRRGLTWFEDPTNASPSYLRNRVRRELIPLLESRYRGGIVSRLAGLAEQAAGVFPRSDDRSAPSVNTSGERDVDPREGFHIEIERRSWVQAEIPRSRTEVVFDAEALVRPHLRLIRPGDRVQPFGMKGRKKVQDVLVDEKFPRSLRKRLIVVADGDGEVLWVPGIVRSARAPVVETTRDVWVFRAVDAPKMPAS